MSFWIWTRKLGPSSWELSFIPHATQSVATAQIQANGMMHLAHWIYCWVFVDFRAYQIFLVCSDRSYIFLKWSHSNPTFLLSIHLYSSETSKDLKINYSHSVLFCFSLQQFFFHSPLCCFITGWIHLWHSSDQALHNISLLEKMAKGWFLM